MQRLSYLGAIALLAALSACGGNDQPTDNIAVENMNAPTNLEEVPPVESAANETVEPAAEEAARQPAPSRPAPPAKPKPTPTEPKPEPAAEPAANDPACAPEHRAAGHC